MASIVTKTFTAGFRLLDGSLLNSAFAQINAAFAGTTAVDAVNTTGTVSARSATATTAGGATGAAVSIGTAGVGIYFGSGVPTISAAQGSLYLRTDGSSTSTRLYVNTNGTTGWTNFTSAT